VVVTRRPCRLLTQRVCRLLTRGTIEEKVYHRQIYKHALATRVLSDPRQRRYVASAGVRDLFVLSDRHAAGAPSSSSPVSLTATPAWYTLLLRPHRV
jgi:hypothetical protein